MLAIHRIAVLLLIVLFTISSARVPPPGYDELTADFEEYCYVHDYPAERHWVTTEDGYIICLYRIQAKWQDGIWEKKKPILLQHGIRNSGDVWILNEEKYALGLKLANEGFDVWMGNNRGTKPSRNHTTLNPDYDSQFWHYSFQEFAQYDLPAMLTYIANYTGFNNVSYIGHSQGGSQMLAALADRVPAVVNKVDKVILIAPAGAVQEAGAMTQMMAKLVSFYKIAEAMGVGELSPYKLGSSYLKGMFCRMVPSLCTWLRTWASDSDSEVLNHNRIAVFQGHLPAGTSLRCAAHFAQMVQDPYHRFKKFDHGEWKNREIYGTEEPPVYNLTKITEKVFVIAGDVDGITTESQVKAIADQLPHTHMRTFHEGHTSFLCGVSDQYQEYILDILNDKIRIHVVKH